MAETRTIGQTRAWAAAGLVLLMGGAAGCFGNETTEFPAGLEPLEDNTAPSPDGTGALVYVDGDNGNYAWVHSRGRIAAAPVDVWRALKDPELMPAVCNTDTHAIEVGVEDGYELSFEISYTVDEILTIAWDEQWRYGTVLGDAAAPDLGMVRYQKVYGSELISLIEGSIQLLATDDPNVTELAFVEHVAAAGGTREDMRTSMAHRFDGVIADLTGGTPPTCP